MKQRIEDRLKELNLSPRAASLSVSTNADLIRGVLRAGDDANPTRETVEKIAQALGRSPEWLLGAEELTGKPRRNAPEFTPAPIRGPVFPSSPLKDLPVWGTAAGSMVSGVEGLHLYTGEAVDYVGRPDVLQNVKSAYGIYVTGDSMYPAHPPGALRLVHPGRPVSPGDTVVVMTRHWADDPGQGYIKTLRRRSGDKLILEQFNPQATIQIPVKYVVFVHKVLDMNDLYG